MPAMSEQGFGHKHDDTPEPTIESKPDTLQRVGITDITDAGRWRRFTRDAKARVVLESRASGVVVSEVARRRRLTPQQLFARLRSSTRGGHSCAR
jgi:Transposase